MIVECDIGNTRCCWRVMSIEGVVLESGGSAHGEDFFSSLDDGIAIHRVRASSVAGTEVKERFMRDVKARWGVDTEFARTTAECAGVVNSYHEPGRLGVDRWLAMIAAYNLQKRAVLVIDAGTALTVDLVDAGGRHLGGYIVPGVGLMQRTLLSDTDGVRFEQKQDAGNLDFGVSTAAAVNNGISASQLGVVVVAIEQARAQIKEGFSILLTGGDSGTIAVQLHEDFLECPELVMDGLKWVLP